MKDTLSGIVSMLEEGGPEQQVAAAQVLAWLKPRTPSVVKALGQVAIGSDGFVRPYAVDALACIGSATALSHLIPLLHAEGPLRHKVARAFGRLGGNAEKVLIREYEKGDHDTRAVILEILAATQGADAMRHIHATLKDPEAGDLARHAGACLRAEIASLDPVGDEETIGKLRKTYLANIKRIPKRAPATYKVHLLEVLARIGDASCRAVFVSNSGPSHPPEVRGAALRGLIGHDLTPNQAAKLVGYLREEDFVNVVGPSLEVLDGFVPKGAQMSGALGRLLTNPRPEVRMFALKGIGTFQTASSAKLLLPFLENPDPKVRRLASEGLGRNPEAREGLVKLLLAGRDLEEASRPVDALIDLASELTPGQVKKIVARFMKLVDADDPVRDLYRRILAACRNEVVEPLLLEEARKLRGINRYRDALRILQTLSLTDKGRMSSDARYELAITTLLMRGREPDLAEGDPVIGHFCHLIRDGYGLIQRVKRERALKTEDVLYLGQRFVERLNDERRFGSELLTWLIKKEPDAKESVQAMQKLKVEGLA